MSANAGPGCQVSGARRRNSGQLRARPLAAGQTGTQPEGAPCPASQQVWPVGVRSPNLGLPDPKAVFKARENLKVQ